MADEFVRSFHTLSTEEQRSTALCRLVRTLNSTERQVLNTAVSNKNDIIPSLPLELVLQVFSYLPLLNTWSLQLVNKRWRQLLSSEAFVRATLSRWDTHDPSDSGRGSEAVAKDSIRCRIRHMLAINLGRPFTVACIDDNEGIGIRHQQIPYRKLQLKGKLIAYRWSQPGDGDSVIVRDLITGITITLRGEAREKIMDIILTTDLVAFVTRDGSLYVTEILGDLSLGPMLRVQLPSSRVQAIGADRECIVLAMNGIGSRKACVREIFLYDSKDKRLRSFPLPEDSTGIIELDFQEMSSNSVLVDSSHGTIDLFTLTSQNAHGERAECYKLKHRRTSLNGEILGESRWSNTIAGTTFVHLPNLGILRPQPTGYRDLYRLQVCESPAWGTLPILKKVDILFDARNGQFVQRSPEAFDTLSKGWCPIEWKDATLDLEQLPFCDANDRYVEQLRLMNNTFLVSWEVGSMRTHRSRIQVFCFDEKVCMHGAVKARLMKSVPKLESMGT